MQCSSNIHMFNQEKYLIFSSPLTNAILNFDNSLKSFSCNVLEAQ